MKKYLQYLHLKKLHTYLFNYAGKKYPLVYLHNYFSDCKLASHNKGVKYVS